MLKFLFRLFRSKTRTVDDALRPLIEAQVGLGEVIEARKVEVTDKRLRVAKLQEDITDADHEVDRAEGIKVKLDELLS